MRAAAGRLFRLARTGFDPDPLGKRFDAVRLDIDHASELVLDETNRSFYTAEGLAAARSQLKPAGRFPLGSDDPADKNFTTHLKQVFRSATAYNGEFPKPLNQLHICQFQYVARTKGGS